MVGEMLKIFITVLFTLSFLIPIIFTIVKSKKIDLLNIFTLGIVLVNGLGLMVVLIGDRFNLLNEVWSKWVSNLSTDKIIYFLFLNIFVIIISNLIKRIKNRTNIKTVNITNKTLRITAYISLVLSIVLYYLYARAYGGFNGLLKESLNIRIGNSSIYNPLSFLQKFGELSVFATYLLWAILINKKQKKLKSDFLIFLIGFAFSIYVLYSFLGRVGFLMFIGTLFISFGFSRIKKINLKVISLAALLFIVLIISVNFLLRNPNSSASIVKVISNELAFIISSFSAQKEANHILFFKDILLGFTALLPTRLVSKFIEYTRAANWNTLYVFGSFKGTDSVWGEAPLDFITFGYTQFSFAGVIIWTLIYGFFLKYIDVKIKKINNFGLLNVCFAYALLNLSLLSVIYGDIYHILSRNFYIIVGLFILFFVNKINKGDSV